MIERYLKILLIFIVFATYTQANEKKPTLLLYCGITMVKPIKEIAKIIEKKENCTIKISQGGSQDLYDALKYSKKGDLYIPGSDTYIINNKKDNLIKEYKYIGTNQASIFVQKGNPKNIKNISDFMREDVVTTICDPNSGSIGKMAKKIITSYKDEEYWNDIFDKAAVIASDSRNLNKSLVSKKVDMTINWNATALFSENKDNIDVINIANNLAPHEKIEIAMLKFSKNEKIAKAFIEFSASKEGQEIMKKYGFN